MLDQFLKSCDRHGVILTIIRIAAVPIVILTALLLIVMLVAMMGGILGIVKL